ncbi:hypothetical protein KC906_03410 [Candidatus Kaiserbacteria bacterium]|nr:hypothetical protein [Candidatus Kaiserbacteria bacterium]
MEKIPAFEYLHSELVERIDRLKRSVVERDSDVQIDFLRQVNGFDAQLNTLLEKYGYDTVVKEGVPEWLRLVGGAVEFKDIDASARVLIIEGVERFVTAMEAEYLE